MTQAFNLSQLANKVNTSGQLDVSSGVTNTVSTSNLPTIPTTKGGTGLTSVGANGTVLKSDGTNLSWGNVAGTVTWQAVQATNFTASSNLGYPVNTTSGAITVTFPASPTAGDMISIVDYAGTAATNNITIGLNGNKANGKTDNPIINTNREGVTFVYADATQGWVAVSDVYSSTPFVTQYTATYLVVAGGGGGGNDRAGGAGAGGYLTGTTTLTAGTVYTATVGGGGSGGATTGANGSKGTNSTFIGGSVSISSIGGGFGCGGSNTGGGPGGSGGGAGSAGPGYNVPGSGTPGQGNNGGTGTPGANPGSAGGGGGAGAVGSNGVAGAKGGNGGVGLANTITGSPVFYAGGGGGGSTNSTPAGGTGGNGGGGPGGPTGPSAGVAGTANTGGGGGGASGTNPGGTGGSGVVIISVPTANYSGTTTGSPTITTNGSNTVIKWTTGSGTYTA